MNRKKGIELTDSLFFEDRLGIMLFKRIVPMHVFLTRMEFLNCFNLIYYVGNRMKKKSIKIGKLTFLNEDFF